MKFGITASTFATEQRPATFGDGQITRHLQGIKDLGYHGVDLFIRPMGEKNLVSLRTALDEAGLGVSVIFPIILFEKGLVLSDPDPERRKQAVLVYKDQIDMAAELKAHIVLGFGRGIAQEGELEGAYHQRLSESLKELSEHGARRGVEILLEPIHRYLISSFNRVDQCLEFFYRFHLGSLKLLLDTFHMNIEEKSLEAAIRMAGDRIGHVHAVDNNRGAPGDGHIDFKGVIRSLLATGYDRYLSVETQPEADPYACARRGIAVLKGILAELRQEELG
ncbi:MAG: sugar phosphate isomerase/epimerase [Spirochaetaceae bacterium]|nr:MAG: sugar phosphate isomerase/epimerase [Spirochaetaceae bacterium]